MFSLPTFQARCVFLCALLYLPSASPVLAVCLPVLAVLSCGGLLSVRFQRPWQPLFPCLVIAASGFIANWRDGCLRGSLRSYFGEGREHLVKCRQWVSPSHSALCRAVLVPPGALSRLRAAAGPASGICVRWRPCLHFHPIPRCVRSSSPPCSRCVSCSPCFRLDSVRRSATSARWPSWLWVCSLGSTPSRPTPVRVSASFIAASRPCSWSLRIFFLVAPGFGWLPIFLRAG